MSDTKRKIILKKLSALNTIWHPETTLIFKSQKDRLVIGRYVNDDVIPLDEEAMLLCTEWNFKPDPTLIPEEGHDESEEAGEEADEEADEEAAEGVSTPVPPPTSAPQRCGNGAEMVKILIRAMEVDLVDMVNAHSEALASKTKEMADLQARYKELETSHSAMEQKFSAMKSLFT